MKHQLLQEAEAMQEQLVSWRRGLHQIPETGTHLPQTVTFIKNQLDAIGIKYKIHENCSCITAELGNGEPCIMLRSDMDGLPIKEESGETFASCNTTLGLTKKSIIDFHFLSTFFAGSLCLIHIYTVNQFNQHRTV